MSVLNKNSSSMMAVYRSYVELCSSQDRVPEPSVNFEDAQDVEDVIDSMKGKPMEEKAECDKDVTGFGIY